MLAAELIGPYTLAAITIVLLGLPLSTRWMRRSVRLAAGSFRAEVGSELQEVKAHAMRAADAAVEVVEAVNNVGPGEPKLIERVQVLQDDVGRLMVGMERSTANQTVMLRGLGDLRDRQVNTDQRVAGIARVLIDHGQALAELARAHELPEHPDTRGMLDGPDDTPEITSG